MKVPFKLERKKCRHNLDGALQMLYIYIVINAFLGKVFCKLRRKPIALFVLLWTNLF